MINKVLIMGHMGNMGKRYGCILNELNVPWIGLDIKQSTTYKFPSKREIDGVIIATQTRSHCEHIRSVNFRYQGIPILCEKPIAKSFKVVQDLLGIKELNLTMVDQYKYALKQARKRGIKRGVLSSYDYFKTGSDGLAWDCINIIRDSTTLPMIRNKSPIWECIINGFPLSIVDIDYSYLDMVVDWLHKAGNNHSYILDSHRNVERFMRRNEYTGYHRNTSKVEQYASTEKIINANRITDCS